MKKAKIIINEVDCYIGNSNNYYKLATNQATQHQVLLNKDDASIPLGRLNSVADAGRYERIVFETEANEEIIKLWEKAVTIRFSFRSEYCNTMEEFKAASEHNKPLRKKLVSVLKEIYETIEIDMPFDMFTKLAIY